MQQMNTSCFCGIVLSNSEGLLLATLTPRDGLPFKINFPLSGGSAPLLLLLCFYRFLVDACELLRPHLHLEGLFRKGGSLTRIRALKVKKMEWPKYGYKTGYWVLGTSGEDENSWKKATVLAKRGRQQEMGKGRYEMG